MAAKFPSAFVDQKTGDIKKFRTTWDRIQDDILPNAAHVGLLAAKVALLAPLAGGLIVAAPVTAGLWWGTRWATRKGLDLGHDKLMQSHRKGEFSEFDLTVAADKAAFTQRFGDVHPGFADDYLRMAKLAKLDQVPKLLIREPYFREQGRSRFASMVSDFMAAATSRPSGKDPVVMLGRGALNELTPEELRAVTGHEFTHVKLGHMQETAKWLGRFSLNSIINTTLVVAAVAGGLPFMPVLGLIGLTNAVGLSLKAVQSRRHEELCDRGAALLTGGTGDLATALDKIKAAMLRMRQLEVDLEFRTRGLDPPEVKEARGLGQLIQATHPTNEKRSKLLQDFAKKYPGYCEKQRSLFSQAFTDAAAPVDVLTPVGHPIVAPKETPPPVKRAELPAPVAKKPAPKPPPPKIKYIRLPKWGFGF